MKKKLLISFLGSIALVIGLCCFSGSALVSDKPVDPVVINSWCSSKGIPSFFSSLDDTDLLFFCYRPKGAILLDGNVYRGNYVCLVAHRSITLAQSGYNFYVDAGYVLQNYNGTAQWVRYDVSGVYDYSQIPVTEGVNDYFSNVDVNRINFDIIYTENYTDYYNQYYIDNPVGDPFEDNNGLFFSVIQSTMGSAYNSAIQPLLTELSSIGLIPFLLFFLAMSVVVVWFFGVVF